MLFAVVIALPSNVFAACSPGIPCTEYDIYSNPTSGTDADLNGPKTEQYAPYEDGACDGNFMNQIYSQAWMESSREILMSEQIIHKPDSVLEYTCFDQFVSIAAHHIGPIFTETTEWEPRDIWLWTGDDPPGNVGITISVVFPDNTLDLVLDSFLTKSIEDYIASNFDHTFLGEATTIDNNIDSSGVDGSGYLGSGVYDCSHMQTVWNIAQCIDFGEDDRFRTFEQLIYGDPRTIPKECSPGHSLSDTIEAGNNATKIEVTSAGAVVDTTTTECPSPGIIEADVNTGFYNDMIRVANNCHDGANLRAYSAYDIMEMYDLLILGVNPSEGTYVLGTGGIPPIGAATVSTVTCAKPIPTGVPVVTYTHDEPEGSSRLQVIPVGSLIHYEYLCPNPGCFYNAPKVSYTINSPVPDMDSLAVGTCQPY